ASPTPPPDSQTSSTKTTDQSIAAYRGARSRVFCRSLTRGCVNGLERADDRVAMLPARVEELLQMRWTMHCCTTICSQVVLIASGSPFKPSHTAMTTSSTPRFNSLNTYSQNLAPPQRRQPRS